MEFNLKRFKKVITVFLLIFVISLVAGCGGKGPDKPVDPDTGKPGKVFDNENDPITFSSMEVDKVFNPFFSTSGADGNVVGMTQISMLGNNNTGEPTYGDDEAVVTKDLQIVSQGRENIDKTTTYYFVLKNNVQFSNGSYLTIKDVLFNLYIYLDNAYTGSSTIYSTDIVGLKEYRTQSANEHEQDSFNQRFEIEAETRIQSLVDAANEIFDEHENEDYDLDQFKLYLTEKSTMLDNYSNIVVDFEKAIELFRTELETDYNNNKDAYQDIVFKDEKDKEYKNLFTTDVEVFLYNNGFISWNKKDAKLESSLVNNPAELKKWTKEVAIQTVFDVKIPSAIEEVVRYWGTSATLSSYLANKSMEEYFATHTERQFSNISGIKFANHKAPVTVNGKEYGVPEYNADGSVKSGNEVLSITIKDVDPKAIWNFAFAVAPMYYYSDQEHIDAFDYESNFGVEYSNQTWMDEVVKHVNNPEKSGVPVGAGPYAASKSEGGITGIRLGDFYNLGVIYYERNPYFIMGPAKIKKLRLQVVGQSNMLNSLYNGEIDFVEPNAKPETEEELSQKIDQGIAHKSIRTAGYGYIGVNAGKVPDINIRRIIMHSIDTELCVQYYKTSALAIHRSMSSENWAYPEDATAYYPFIEGEIPTNLSVVSPQYAKFVMGHGYSAGQTLSKKDQIEFIKYMVEDAGYTIGSNGIYFKGNHTLKYTFTIAGEVTDHPAFQALLKSSKILNANGFDINVTTDANALKKLSSGALTVWAAAWGSTIDPDMYQVYHKDSKATSTLNWGYKQIKQNAGGKYDLELALVEELSTLIEEGRKTNIQSERKRIYSDALDIVMELAIELPTYQRNDLYAYNSDKIDQSSLTPEELLSSYKGLTSDIWNVSLNVER